MKSLQFQWRADDIAGVSIKPLHHEKDEQLTIRSIYLLASLDLLADVRMLKTWWQIKKGGRLHSSTYFIWSRATHSCAHLRPIHHFPSLGHSSDAAHILRSCLIIHAFDQHLAERGDDPRSRRSRVSLQA